MRKREWDGQRFSPGRSKQEKVLQASRKKWQEGERVRERWNG
jgi:hypothetical protein